MPDWGSTDILNSKGKEDAAAQARAMATTSAATDPNIDTSPGNPAPNVPAAGTGTTTTPPYKQTLDANGGPSSPPPGPGKWHWDNVGKHWVSDDYSQDGNGRPLTEAERQAAIDADRRRASLTAARAGGGGGGADPNKGLASNAVYDDITQTYSMVDSDGVWTKGLKPADLEAKLSENLKKQYPDWWWGQYANQQNQARRYEVDAGAFDAQKFASMGAQSTRFGPTNF